jgi:hypothetical protein
MRRASLEGLDVVVVMAALFGTQEQLESDPALAQKVLTVDFANTTVFCEEARKLLHRGGGTPCVFVRWQATAPGSRWSRTALPRPAFRLLEGPDSSSAPGPVTVW